MDWCTTVILDGVDQAVSAGTVSSDRHEIWRHTSCEKALPRRVRQGRPDHLHETCVGVGGDQPGPALVRPRATRSRKKPGQETVLSPVATSAETLTTRP